MNTNVAPKVSRTAQLVSRRSLSSTHFRKNNAQDIERLNHLIKKKLMEAEEAERKRVIDAAKPKISDFQRPLLTTFVIASTAYLTLHLLWWHLEYPLKEEELKQQLAIKEKELQDLIEEKSKELNNNELITSSKQGRSWLGWAKFW